MARGDLIISLVRASVSGDKRAFRSTVEAIIAEENGRQHKILADRLTRALNANSNGMQIPQQGPDAANRGRDFIAEINPRRRLDDLGSGPIKGISKAGLA